MGTPKNEMNAVIAPKKQVKDAEIGTGEII
jgi:hypothetical protein